MLPMLHLTNPADSVRITALLNKLRLDTQQLLDIEPKANSDPDRTMLVIREALDKVAKRGDRGIIDAQAMFDPGLFSVDQIRITPQEIEAATKSVSSDVLL